MTAATLPRPGTQNGTLLGLIAEGRITRSQLNEETRAGKWSDIHRPLIADALKEKGL